MFVRQDAATEHQEARSETDAERLHDIEQKLRCWGYLSHYPDAERDVAWLVNQLAERDERVAEFGGAATVQRMLSRAVAAVRC